MIMSDKVELCQINDIPDKLLDDIGRIIKCYTTAIILVTIDSKGEQCPLLIGSGTFVSTSNVFGILTAAHVVEKLIKKREFGRPYLLGLTLNDYAQRYAIHSNSLEPIIIANGQIESDGPDLGFIVLPHSEKGTIEATKIFHNLDKNRVRILTAPPRFNEGLWAICGVPDEKTIDEHPDKRFAPFKGFFMFIGFGGVSGTYTVGGYDYCDIKVKHNISPIIPDSFGGVSGGGLWQIPLKRSSLQTIEPIEYILSGVAFYQTDRVGLYRSIKCHGRKSIYDLAYSFIAENRKPKTENR
jgi:hypothetical protein